MLIAILLAKVIPIQNETIDIEKKYINYLFMTVFFCQAHFEESGTRNQDFAILQCDSEKA